MIMMHVDNLKLITQCFILYSLQTETKAFQYRMRLWQDVSSILAVAIPAGPQATREHRVGTLRLTKPKY